MQQQLLLLPPPPPPLLLLTRLPLLSRLVTRDNAEYLLGAETESSMSDWVTKIGFHAELPPSMQLLSYDIHKVGGVGDVGCVWYRLGCGGVEVTQGACCVMQCCAVQCSAVLCSAMQCCALLYSAVQWCAVQRYGIL